MNLTNARKTQEIYFHYGPVYGLCNYFLLLIVLCILLLQNKREKRE